MANPVTIKGGKIRVLLDPAGTGSYAQPCGFTSRSMTITKSLNVVLLPDCDDPDAVPWEGQDATSLGIAITGEGVLASESVETWLDAVENVDSIATKIEWEFPAKTITWTGRTSLETVAVTGENGRRATANVSLKSDGEMVRTVA